MMMTRDDDDDDGSAGAAEGSVASFLSDGGKVAPKQRRASSGMHPT